MMVSKYTIKLKSTLALLITVVFCIFPTAFSHVYAQESNIEDDCNSSPVILAEIEDLRTVTGKVYQLSDGTRQYVGYTEPIHYFDESTGDYREIDNKITNCASNSKFKYRNASNSWNAFFADEINSTDAVTIQKGDYSISFSMPYASSLSKVKKASELQDEANKSVLNSYFKFLHNIDQVVLYTDIMNGIDISYTVNSGTLKESIIIKNKEATHDFIFNITSKNLEMISEHGRVKFKNSDNETVFEFSDMFAEDALGKHTNDVSYSITPIRDGYRMTVSVDEEFLDDKDTTYPVIVDPTTMITGTSNTTDTCVDQQYPNSNYYLHESLWTGGALGTNAMRTYIKFNLPILEASRVLSAKISIKKRAYETPTVKAYRVTSDWEPSEITWNNKPPYSSSVQSGIAELYSGSWYRIDVTDIVKKWLSYEYSNYGFVLKEPNEVDANQKTRYYSSEAPSPNKPELIINYISLGSRPYQNVTSSDVNCMGYALEYNDFISGYDLGLSLTQFLGCNTEEMLAIIKNASEEWMNNNLGDDNGDGSDYYEEITSYTTDIDQGWYRVVLRVGFADLNDNGVFDTYDLDNASIPMDYHWWYETTNNFGCWAEKRGGSASQLLSGTQGIDPAASAWVLTAELSYNSTPIYYKIKDIRDNNW